AGRPRGMAFPEALPAPAAGELYQPTIRPARRGIPRYSVGDRDRLGGRVGQRLSQGHAGTVELSPRAVDRLYLLGFCGGVRLRRLDHPAGTLRRVDRARRLDR